jgi:iron complex transport system ATP-binding protein
MQVDGSDRRMEAKPCVQVKDLPVELSGLPIYPSLNLNIRCGSLAVISGVYSPAWTTLLQMLAGIRPVQSGRIELWGYPIGSINRRDMSSHICFVPKKHRPVFNYSVQEYVLQGCEARLKPLQTVDSSDRERVMQVLKRMDIENLSGRNSEFLSNAEHQKVILARALAQNARLTILDEPVENLDETDRYRVMAILLETALQNQLTLVAAMQDPGLGLLLADQMLIFDSNGIMADLDRKQPDFAAAAERALARALPGHPAYRFGFELPEEAEKSPTERDPEKPPQGFIF